MIRDYFKNSLALDFQLVSAIPLFWILIALSALGGCVAGSSMAH